MSIIYKLIKSSYILWKIPLTVLRYILKKRSIKTIRYKYFSFNGRIGRMDYFLRGIILCSAIMLTTLALVFINGFTKFSHTLEVMNFDEAIIPFYCITFPFHLWSNACLATKRLHDLNMSGWWCIAHFIPVLSFFIEIFLLFFRGTNGVNKYGSNE